MASTTHQIEQIGIKGCLVALSTTPSPSGFVSEIRHTYQGIGNMLLAITLTRREL